MNMATFISKKTPVFVYSLNSEGAISETPSPSNGGKYGVLVNGILHHVSGIDLKRLS